MTDTLGEGGPHCRCDQCQLKRELALVLRDRGELRAMLGVLHAPCAAGVACHACALAQRIDRAK